MKQTIYLDNASTTPVHPAVAKKVQELMIRGYGNPSSLHHKGRESREEIEKSREEIAKFINAETEEIVFTSGGTESNNLAIKGLALANPGKKHIITSAIEHHAIYEVCEELEKQGYEIDYLSVGSEGIVNPEEIKMKITPKTLLVSIMHVNNEIGTIQPIEEIGKICKEKGVLFHTDAVQSFTKLEIDVKKMNITMLSASGHKINAPKGTGILYLKKGVKIMPLFQGGGQEKGLRSGTENVPGAVGMAEALKLERNKEKIKKIRDRMLNKILKIPGTRLNGSKEGRIYNNINVSFYGIEGESLITLLDNWKICASTGSACSSKSLEPSAVLKALDQDKFYIHGSLRLTLDSINEEEEDFVVEKIKESVEKLREMSPFKLNEKEGKNEKNS